MPLLPRSRARPPATSAPAQTGDLRLNGATSDFNFGVGQLFEAALDAAPTGPDHGRYALWVWSGRPTTRVDLRAHRSLLGCTVSPTPLSRSASPQPVLCLRGRAIPMVACGHAHEFHAPADAPWVIRFAQGLARPVTFTIQGVLEDARAANATGFSVTNAVLLIVQ